MSDVLMPHQEKIGLIAAGLIATAPIRPALFRSDWPGQAWAGADGGEQLPFAFPIIKIKIIITLLISAGSIQ